MRHKAYLSIGTGRRNLIGNPFLGVIGRKSGASARMIQGWGYLPFGARSPLLLDTRLASGEGRCEDIVPHGDAPALYLRMQIAGFAAVIKDEV
jgi:hypothetical protein